MAGSFPRPSILWRRLVVSRSQFSGVRNPVFIPFDPWSRTSGVALFENGLATGRLASSHFRSWPSPILHWSSTMRRMFRRMYP